MVHRKAVLTLGGMLIIAGCAPASSLAPLAPSVKPSAVALSPSPSGALTAADWAEDLAQLDKAVRASHPSPFTIHPETEWVAKLAGLKESLPEADPDEQIVLMASLVGLLDTHSWLTAASHHYGVLVYPFADGWFVVRAVDPALVGSRLVSIGGTPVADIEAALRPLVPADNESGKLDGMQGLMSSVEYLHGLGIVKDPTKPAFVFEKDGSRTTVDLGSVEYTSWEQKLDSIGGVVGRLTEAVKLRGTPVWTRLDAPNKTFLLAYNDYTEDDLAPALEAMTVALDDGSADRVVLDMRYIRGGNGSLADPLVQALSSDKRINKPGGLTVLIGRENVSAGTLVASRLEALTDATFAGEQTPARAANFLCRCLDITMEHPGFLITVPTYWNETGDIRDSVPPDVAYSMTAADFFAGNDRLLDAVMSGDLESLTP